MLTACVCACELLISKVPELGSPASPVPDREVFFEAASSLSTVHPPPSGLRGRDDAKSPSIRTPCTYMVCAQPYAEPTGSSCMPRVSEGRRFQGMCLAKCLAARIMAFKCYPKLSPEPATLWPRDVPNS